MKPIDWRWLEVELVAYMRSDNQFLDEDTETGSKWLCDNAFNEADYHEQLLNLTLLAKALATRISERQR